MSANPEIDHAITTKVLESVCANLVPLGLPFMIIVGLPNEGAIESGVGRAACGLGDARNRAFLRAKFTEYLDGWDKGELKPNRKMGKS